MFVSRTIFVKMEIKQADKIQSYTVCWFLASAFYPTVKRHLP